MEFLKQYLSPPPTTSNAQQTPNSLFVAGWVLLLGVLLALGRLYQRTMPPGMTSLQGTGWSDSAAMQVVGAYWGIAHSPGYPLYTILANLWTRLIGLFAPTTEPAWRVSLFSVALALLSLLLFAWLLHKMGVSLWLTAGAVAWLGTRPVFWQYAIIAEMYMLNLALGLTLLALVWGWFQHSEQFKREVWLWLAVGATLGGLAVHHRTGVLFGGTAFIWLMMFRWRDGRLWLKRAAWVIVAGAPMLLLYAYLPLTATLNAGQTRLYADASQPGVFWFMVQSREWWGLVQGPQSLAEAGQNVLALLTQQAETLGGWAWFVVASLGLLGWQARRVLWLGVAGSFLLFGTLYRVDDIDSMLIPLTVALMAGLALAAQLVVEKVSVGLGGRLKDDRSAGHFLRLALPMILGLGWLWFGGVVAAESEAEVDLSGDTVGQDMVEAVRIFAEDGYPLSILAEGNTPLAIVQYAQARYQLDNVEPLSATAWRTRYTAPGADRTAIDAALASEIAERWAAGQAVFYSAEVTDLAMLPWLTEGLADGSLRAANTSFPDLKRLLPGESLPDFGLTTTQPVSVSLPGGATLIGTQSRWVQRRAGIYLRTGLCWQAGPSPSEAIVTLYGTGSLGVALEAVQYAGLGRGVVPFSAWRAGQVWCEMYEQRLNQLPEAGFEGAGLGLAFERAGVVEQVSMAVPPFPSAWLE